MEYCYDNERINSANDASTWCENFVNFRPVTPEFIEFICDFFVRHGKNGRIQPNISQYTSQIFAIFSPNESVLGADDRTGPHFPWQPIL